MRYDETCQKFAALAHRQSELSLKAPYSFFAGAMLAGSFVAIATILSLSVGVHLDPSVRPLVMGSVFGISIVLTIFGGGELFTGQIMFATFALLHGRLTPLKALQLLAMSWFGNLWGAALIGSLFALGGGGHVYEPSPLLQSVVDFKIHSSAVSLVARGILCNWLACVGIWTAARLESDTAKIVVLAWCVMTYVTCGFEHSIANMTLFAVGLMAPVPVGDVLGAASSVALVSVGNLLGGGVLVAAAYALYAKGSQPLATDMATPSTELAHMPATVQASLAKLARDGLTRAA